MSSTKPFVLYIGRLKSGKSFPDDKEWTNLDAFEVHTSTTVALTYTSPEAFCNFSDSHRAIWKKWRFLDEPNSKGDDGSATTIVLTETDLGEIVDLPQESDSKRSLQKAVVETTLAIQSALAAALLRFPKRKLYLHIRQAS